MEPKQPSQAETDAKLRAIAERFVDALSDALRQTQREWHRIPFLPLLIGINRGAEGAVRSWALRFTWMRKGTTVTLPIANDTDDPVGMTVEPIHQARRIVPCVPCSLARNDTGGHPATMVGMGDTVDVGATIMNQLDSFCTSVARAHAFDNTERWV